MPEPLRVAIVEDNYLLRSGLESLLNLSADFECAGAFDSAIAALNVLPQVMTDVVLMDIDLPGMNGLEYTKEIKSDKRTAHIQVIMLTVLEDEYKVLEAILAGASGYLVKSASPEMIMDSIRQVSNGGSPMSPPIARKVFSLMKVSYSIPQHKIELNTRELEVLEGLVAGLTYKMIGEKYHIALDTVRTYIRTIYEKLQVHSRSAAIVKAIRQKLI